MGVVKSTICFLLADIKNNKYSAFCERMKMLVKVCSFFGNSIVFHNFVKDDYNRVKSNAF